MHIAALLVALWLLWLAFTAIVRITPSSLPGNLIVAWFIPSFLAQMTAAPMALAGLAVTVIADDLVTRVAGALAAILFALVHLRNRRDGAALLRAVGLPEAIPLTAGLWPISNRSGVRRIERIAYADDGERTTLDVIVPADGSAKTAPVLLHIHGGAWVLGKRNQQARPLIHHLVRHGWVCVDINYRLGPKHRFPAMIVDVLRAIAWTKANIAQYGGDPERMALTGGSAGGHLTALAALGHDRAEFKPGFEAADCAVRAAVPCYGRFDFADRLGLWGRNHAAFLKFEADKVMPPGADPALYDLASPIALVRGDAPPMLVLHGRHDTLIPCAEGAAFAKAQREAGGNVDHIELGHAQHAYDVMQSALTWAHVRAVRAWLERYV